MSDLAKLQQLFAIAIHDNDAGNALPLLEPRYLSIYRNSIIFNHTQALKETYPITMKLVGEDFFNTAAYFYQRQFPATDSNFNEYGQHLAEFLQHYSPTKALAYLAEMAALEWALHSAYYAADSVILDPLTLSTIPEEDYQSCRFKLQPSCQLLQFKHSILELWQACQDFKEETQLELVPEAQYLVLVKQDDSVKTTKLSYPEFILLSQLATGVTLLEANHALLLTDSTTDLATCLLTFVARAYIHSVSWGDAQ